MGSGVVMPFDDPNTWMHGAAALKAGFDAFRSAIAGLKEIRALGGGTPEQNKVVDEALDHAVRTAAIAEAEVAKALGYELCKCEFPPTIMLTVGYRNERGPSGKGPVFECPKCGYNTAGPWAFTRTAPKREQ
jgi:hypothetical protein